MATTAKKDAADATHSRKGIPMMVKSTNGYIISFPSRLACSTWLGEVTRMMTGSEPFISEDLLKQWLKIAENRPDKTVRIPLEEFYGWTLWENESDADQRYQLAKLMGLVLPVPATAQLTNYTTNQPNDQTTNQPLDSSTIQLQGTVTTSQPCDSTTNRPNDSTTNQPLDSSTIQLQGTDRLPIDYPQSTSSLPVGYLKTTDNLPTKVQPKSVEEEFEDLLNYKPHFSSERVTHEELLERVKPFR